MKHKGFVRQIADETMDDAVRRLQRTGIPRKYIFIEKDFNTDAEWLQRGDHLTVCSLRELGCSIELLLSNLAFLCKTRITLRALDESWYDLANGAPKDIIQGLSSICDTKDYRPQLQHLQNKKRPGRPPGLMKKTEGKCRRCAELLATTGRTQTEVLAELHLSPRSWKRYITTVAPRLGNNEPLNK